MTPEEAARRLAAAGLNGHEADWLLVYLCGWAPDGVTSGLAKIMTARRQLAAEADRGGAPRHA